MPKSLHWPTRPYMICPLPPFTSLTSSFPTLCLIYSVPATLVLIPSSWPLYILFPLPGMVFTSWLVSYVFQVYTQTLPSQWVLSWPNSKIALPPWYSPCTFPVLLFFPALITNIQYIWQLICLLPAHLCRKARSIREGVFWLLCSLMQSQHQEQYLIDCWLIQ